MVFLLVKSASEFNKMIELRKQMEVVLHDIKGKMRRKNVTSSYSELNNCTVISASNCWEDESASNLISFQNATYHLDNDVEFGTKCICKTTLEKKRCLEINQLEEELEAELERLHRKTEGSSVLPQQQCMEVFFLYRTLLSLYKTVQHCRHYHVFHIPANVWFYSY